MFGKDLVHETFRRKPCFDAFTKVYQKSIVDEVEQVFSPDGTTYVLSDISILKGVNANSQPALVEALSVRMQQRNSLGVPNISDKEILSIVKNRRFQDRTEIEEYTNALKKALGDKIEDMNYQELLDTLDKENEVKQSENLNSE